MKFFKEWEMFAYPLREYLQSVCNCTPKLLKTVQLLNKGATYLQIFFVVAVVCLWDFTYCVSVTNVIMGRLQNAWW